MIRLRVVVELPAIARSVGLDGSRPIAARDIRRDEVPAGLVQAIVEAQGDATAGLLEDHEHRHRAAIAFAGQLLRIQKSKQQSAGAATNRFQRKGSRSRPPIIERLGSDSVDEIHRD